MGYQEYLYMEVRGGPTYYFGWCHHVVKPNLVVMAWRHWDVARKRFIEPRRGGLWKKSQTMHPHVRYDHEGTWFELTPEEVERIRGFWFTPRLRSLDDGDLPSLGEVTRFLEAHMGRTVRFAYRSDYHSPRLDEPRLSREWNTEYFTRQEAWAAWARGEGPGPDIHHLEVPESE